MENGRATAPEPRAAPGELEMVRQFINGKSIERGTDNLTSIDALAAWLQNHDFNVDNTSLTDDSLQLFLRIREGLRALVMINTGEPPEKTALKDMQSVAQRLGLEFQVGSDGSLRAVPSGDGLERAAGKILLVAYRSMLDGTWTRLKVCSSDTCRWAFFDNSKNQTGKWCSMAVCGNRSKVRRYLKEHQTGKTASNNTEIRNPDNSSRGF